ncbi:hypothetical protein QP994_09070 [Corynebacterium sp. MSK044]|uniref:Uncharacterized protein n=1 Tax=Corynebacterium tuscaniense TaxID=302449 RepID=A0A2N6T6D9_9CORY|nr:MULTISPECIES: hypothetical protein [Corynebacterium]KAA8735821.1 hypothetical protein F4V54_07530 [Corynebacterium tuscaniense]KGF23438.1 hypothetical protein HMPREF2129_04420 [Corynebacterium tuscaniense DNF00037]MDK8795446.1 hypothetical protein [Corynebacterium sp. MSK041]MDK8798026.1 hypothetical protein [Corynebacterium sp. MSK044]PMC64877.1 hypothetical protein CJ203_04305 [Corynebacterium tuscaniense]
MANSEDTPHISAQLVNVPLDDFMARLIAQELPILDSTSRGIVYDELRAHKEAGKPVITSQEELPARIREIMEL